MAPAEPAVYRQRVATIYHDSYEHSLGVVPLDPERATKILAFLTEEGLIETDDLWIARAPALRAMLRVHDPDYIESLQRHEVVERIFGAPAIDEELEHVWRCSGSRSGARSRLPGSRSRAAGVAVNLGGGQHHATRDAGMGFCLFNDIAVAVTRLRAKGLRDPVLVVDLDVHDGNGTREISPGIRRSTPIRSTVTTGAAPTLWLRPPSRSALMSATRFISAHSSRPCPRVFAATNPGLVIYLAGADPAADDVLGNWKISAHGMMVRDEFVIEICRRKNHRMPIAIVLGGGYGPRSWKYTARFLSWLICGRVIEPPGNEELTLSRFRRIRKTIDPNSLTTEPGDFTWKLTEEDLAGILPGVPRRTRFLSYFSRHGVELLLERFGILDQLRVRGFENPTVEVDLSHPVGQTVRIHDGPDHKEILMELRVNRDSRLVPGCELLNIEWLLLQNPQSDFGPYRRPLPGQNHPGLGMLKEIFGWLVMLAEVLELDGIGYVPSNYHVASQSRRLVAFVNPEHEAWMRALEELFREVPLAEASRIVADGGVVIEATGEPLRWMGYAMVLPVSDRLKERVSGETYNRAVAEALVYAKLRLAV